MKGTATAPGKSAGGGPACWGGGWNPIRAARYSAVRFHHLDRDQQRGHRQYGGEQSATSHQTHVVALRPRKLRTHSEVTRPVDKRVGKGCSMGAPPWRDQMGVTSLKSCQNWARTKAFE